MKTKTIIITMLVLFYNYGVVFSETPPVAVIKDFTGDIIITFPTLQPKHDLLLYDGMVVYIPDEGELSLLFKNGVEKVFSGNLEFQIIDKNTLKSELLVKPLNYNTHQYIETTKINRIYSVDKIAGDMGYTDLDKEISLLVKHQINKINRSIYDEKFKALLKGNCYRKNGYENLALKEFRIHYRLMYQDQRNVKNKKN